jgi:DNA-binding CsgD family transcriptional regulator
MELSNKQISEKLFISIKTVDSHRQNLLHKLNVKNTAGLVKAAYRLNLFD